MKKFTKILAVALAVLMLATTGITAFADEIWYLDPDGADAFVDVPRNGEEVWVFIPERDGCYGISTYLDGDDLDADPEITVYDEWGYVVAYCDDYFSDDFMACVEFYAYYGETYYVHFTDAKDNKATYYAYVYDACYDCDGDGYCDGCYDLLCICKCHNNGFFWRIKNFFNKLFGINEWCDCGWAHW